MKSISFLIILLSFILPSIQFYSPYYRKCKLKSDGIDLGALQIQKNPEYRFTYQIQEPVNTALPINYTDLDFIYDSYIAAGGSGEVYLVEDEKTGKHMILKRFFKEKRPDFEMENYIMHKMNYSIGWHHDDNNPSKATIASYESKESITLSKVQIEQSEVEVLPSILYKIVKELLKSQKQGILHHDLKMANILVNSPGFNLKASEIQLIDWNLAMFYYLGLQSNMKQGTTCYYPPEQLLRNQYITPNGDIFALAVVLFTFLTQEKPFPMSCKQDNLDAIVSLVGSQKFLKFFHKYRSINIVDMQYYLALLEHPDKYQGGSIRYRIREKYESYFNEQLIDLLEKMMEVDPEYRPTAEQVLMHPYFDRVKKLPGMMVKKQQGKNRARSTMEAPANNLIDLSLFDSKGGE